MLRQVEQPLSSVGDYGLAVASNNSDVANFSDISTEYLLSSDRSDSLNGPGESYEVPRNAQFPRLTDNNRGTCGSAGSDDSHLRMEELKTHAWADNSLTESDGSNMGGGVTGGCNNGNNGNSGGERTSSRQESFEVEYNPQARSESVEVEYNPNARSGSFEVEYRPNGLFPRPSVPVHRLEPEGSSSPTPPVCANNNSQETGSTCEVTEETEVKQPYTADRHVS